MCPCNIHTPRAGRNDQIVYLGVHQCAVMCQFWRLQSVGVLHKRAEAESKLLIPSLSQRFSSYPRLCLCPGSSATQK